MKILIVCKKSSGYVEEEVVSRIIINEVLLVFGSFSKNFRIVFIRGEIKNSLRIKYKRGYESKSLLLIVVYKSL
jgi:hypothetical protein